MDKADSKSARFRLIDKDGKAYSPFRLKPSVRLYEITQHAFPGQSQDDGWDVERV